MSKNITSAVVANLIADIANLRDSINKNATTFASLEPKARAALSGVKLPVMGHKGATSIDVLDALHTELIRLECEVQMEEKLAKAELARKSNSPIEQPTANTGVGRFIGRVVRKVEAAVA